MPSPGAADADFSGTPLNSARVDPYALSEFHYVMRVKFWDQTYESMGPALKFLIQRFWAITDYGRSSFYLFTSFFWITVGCALIYMVPVNNPDGSIVTGLRFFDAGETGMQPIDDWVVPFRALYFSVVTMTTLGFGDVSASPHSIVGHVLVTFQVIAGYTLLGALLTRMAILFRDVS